MIEVHELSGGYHSSFRLENINFHVRKGEFFGIIGPNGSGKTTLVKMISGIMQSEQGYVTLQGKDITQYRPKQLAKKLAVLPQLTEQSFRFTVKETVALGRYAHQSGLFTTLSKYDEEIIKSVMDHTDISEYKDVTIDQLSGGERQRVFLAQALAQDPEVIILDEPTNHLDLTYQKELLDLLNEWTVERNLTVISIFHDLNIASLYCDRLLLLQEGKIHVCDVPNEVLQYEHILEVYRTKVESRSHPVVPKLQVMLTPKRTKYEQVSAIDEAHLTVTNQMISYAAPSALKTVSTNPLDIGNGWYKKFMSYHIADGNATNDIKHLLKQHAHERNETILMFTTANVRNRAVRTIKIEGFTLFVVVTADPTNTIHSSLRSYSLMEDDWYKVGSLHTWIFIDGTLLDYTFMQAIVTATEAKTIALQQMNIIDVKERPKAIDTATDHILIAATQSKSLINTATMTSQLGAYIGEAVYECTLEALQKK